MTAIRHFLLINVWVVCAVAAHANEIKLRTVALSGQQAPGAPEGAVFELFYPPIALNEAGQVAFEGFLQVGLGGVTSNDRYGVWSEGNGSLGLVALGGTQAPGTPTGTKFFTFDRVTLNNAGQTAFYGSMQIGEGDVADHQNSRGIWSNGSGSLNLVARSGSHAPGTPNITRFSTFARLALSDQGNTTFSAGVLPGIGAPSNVEGIWSESASGLELVASLGGQAPGLPSGTTFSDFHQLQWFASNTNGDTAFYARLQTSAFDVGEGIWMNRNGAVELVVRDGEQAPGTPPGATFARFFGPFDTIALNDLGRIAFHGELDIGAGDVTQENRRGIWSDRSGALDLVARQSDQAPGMPDGATFSQFFFQPPDLNDVGRIAFSAAVQAEPDVEGLTQDSRIGIWSDGFGALALVARTGDHAPGTPNEAVFDAFSAPVLNNRGQVAFTAALRLGFGGVNGNNAIGIWAQDLDGQLQLIVRNGEMIEVAPNDVRQIRGIGLNPSFQVFTGDEPKGFNDRGQIVFTASFTDGSRGVFVASFIPEPSSALLLAVAASILAITSARSPSRHTRKGHSATTCAASDD